MLDVPGPATGVTAGTTPGGGGWVTTFLGTLPENWRRYTPHQALGSSKDILEPKIRVRYDTISLGLSSPTGK